MTNADLPCKNIYKWLRAVHGRFVCGVLTGQDRRALDVFAHAVELWCGSDMNGRRGAAEAMRGAIRAMQSKTRWLAREAIICVADYGFVEEIWANVAAEFAPVQIPDCAWRPGQLPYSARSR